MKTMKDKKEQKRALILNAAIKLYSVNGFEETKIADVAKEAGVSFGTVFSYFESKNALYEAAILEPLEEIRSYFENVEDHFQGDPLDVMKAMIDCHVEIFSTRKELLLLIQQVLARPSRFPNLFEELDGFVNSFVDSINSIIEEGQKLGYFYKGSPSLIAESYLSFINGIRLTFIDDETNPVWERFKIQALRLFGPFYKSEE
ncbi:TetR/AcrR family transcriptional regulator [Filobacillus milosensis]|uniref:TetR/AcrR family transcriptional regulator n=1 Tax=Filobacillus milosensis TaxID=94137 RepID=A0A4Y8IEW8_9BACI|nr:TetR/AcrR family transcriptional regulator [Filobacillus milosensis]TFB15038.1 TetR/AcrR family transcriptional regulator [Filobacillus milosensis]